MSENIIKNLVLLTNKMEPETFVQNNVCTMYEFVFFHTPVLFSYEGKFFFQAPKNSAILFSVGSHQHYKCCGEYLLNSFAIIDTDESYFKQFSIKPDTLFVIPDKFANSILIQMDRLSYVINTPFAKNLKKHSTEYLNDIMKQVGEAYEFAKMNTSAETEAFSDFSKIRNLMFEDPVKYTVLIMAEQAGFSESHFGRKYKKIFNILPSRDRKIQLVKFISKYLDETKMTLEQIAEKCNITSVPHLINTFKEITGVTPHQYRLNKQKKD